MAEEVKISVQERSTLDELLLQIRMMELDDEQSPSASVQRLYECCMQLFITKLPESIRKYVGFKPLTSLSDALNLVQEWTESEAENVTVHTDTSPGESVEPQQVQTEDIKPSIQESAEETGARPISGTNYKREIIINDQRIKEWIANCPINRNIQNPEHHLIFKHLKIFKWLFNFGLITEDKLRKYVTNFELDEGQINGDGGSTEKVKKRLQFILFEGNKKDLRDFDQLEEDLIKTLDDEDPVERIKKALLHPIFYSESRKEELVVEVGNQKEVKGQKLNKNQKKKIKSYSKGKTFQNWKTKINEMKPGLVEEMEMARAEYRNQENATYPETLYGLVRFIRNCKEHRPDVTIKFTSEFPDLFKTVYMLAKEKNWIYSGVKKK